MNNLSARLLVCLCWLTLCQGVQAVTKNGFVLDDASIPAREIVHGGPPRDGIVAVTSPTFLSAEKVNYLKPQDRVLGLTIGETAKAYPIKFLTIHEIVNDAAGAKSFTVSYCPLCGSGVVFATNLNKSVALNFGVSGLLYNSDLLLYDRNTESLWTQIGGEAISGKLKGVKLPRLPVMHTSWADWRIRHPETLVMRGEKAFTRLYLREPYPGYASSRELYFKVKPRPPGSFHPKERVLGLELNGVSKAYPFIELSKQTESSFADSVGGEQITVHWDDKAQNAYITNESGTVVVSTVAYWFAWYAFNPDTQIYRTAH